MNALSLLSLLSVSSCMVPKQPPSTTTPSSSPSVEGEVTGEVATTSTALPPSFFDFSGNIAGSVSMTEVHRAFLYSSAAYCTPQFEQNGFTCGVCRTDDLSSFTYHNNFTGPYDVIGYWGIDDQHNQLIFAFRGSSDTANWIDNLHADFVSPSGSTVRTTVPPTVADYPQYLQPLATEMGSHTEIKVHDGFYAVADKLRTLILDTITAHGEGRHVLFTGHSLGGAVAAAATAMVADPNSYTYSGTQDKLHEVAMKASSVQAVTFGQPRVGNAAFALFLTAAMHHLPGVSRLHRITHYRDVVPHVPPRALGYYHGGVEFFYPDEEMSFSSSYETCSTPGTKECANSVTVPTSVSDHVTYYGITFSQQCEAFQAADSSLRAAAMEAEAAFPIWAAIVIVVGSLVAVVCCVGVTLAVVAVAAKRRAAKQPSAGRATSRPSRRHTRTGHADLEHAGRRVSSRSNLHRPR